MMSQAIWIIFLLELFIMTNINSFDIIYYNYAY